jgi:hypothetical protein
VWEDSHKATVNRIAADFFTEGGKETDFLSPKMFPGSALADGQAVMAHDAVLTAVFAIRPGQERQEQQDEQALPTPDGVAQNLYALSGTNKVPGASGDITLDNDGYARNKAVPLLRRRPGDRVDVLDVAFPEQH